MTSTFPTHAHVLQERVTNLREHREFEKEFEVKTALVGERALDEAAQVHFPLCRE